MNEQIILTAVITAIITGTIAAIISKMGAIRRDALHAVRRAWHRIHALCRRLIVIWRERKAQTIVERHLKGCPPHRGVVVSVSVYQESLRASPTATRHLSLSIPRVDCPEWFNDYYFAKSLETLMRTGRVVQIRRYNTGYWPPQEYEYIFRHRGTFTSKSVEAEVEQVQNDYICMVYQGFRGFSTFDSCPIGDRFEHIPYAKTLSQNRSEYGTTIHKKESAPSCAQCWKRAVKAKPLGNLVRQFLKNELAELVALSSKPIQDEFIETVVSHCIDLGHSHEDMAVVLEITKRAVTIYDCHSNEQPDSPFSAEDLHREWSGKTAPTAF